MANAPAGWYEQPGAPGITRYWDGTAWLPPGVGPAAPVAAHAPQSTIFTPTTPLEPVVAFRPEPALSNAPAAVSATPATPVPVPAAAAAAEADESVPWDVVGVARTPEAPTRDSVQRPQWQAGAEQPFAFNPTASTAYTQQWTPAQYAPPLPERRTRSGMSKIAVSIAVVAIGFGVRWAFGFFFGGDYSVDGDIEVDVPAYWTTHSVSNPDVTYAMDANWQDVTGSHGLQLTGAGMQVIDARMLSTDFSGNQAIMLLFGTTFPLPDAQASRGDLTEGFDEAIDALEAAGADIVSSENYTVLESRAGDHWGFSEAELNLQGVGLTYYMAATVIDDYIVGVELVVPEGVELTKHDLLAVANSVRER